MLAPEWTTYIYVYLRAFQKYRVSHSALLSVVVVVCLLNLVGVIKYIYPKTIKVPYIC